MKQHLALEDIERLLVMASKEIHNTDYACSAPRDRRWFRAGLEHGILNLVVIDYLLRFTVLDSNERQTVSIAAEEDRNWLQQIKTQNL